MSNRHNLAVFAILLSLVSVLGFLIWSGEVVLPGSDSPEAAFGAQDGAEQGAGEAVSLPSAGESLGGERLDAGREASGRSRVETPELAPDPNTILLSGRLIDAAHRPIADLEVEFTPNIVVSLANLKDMPKLSREHRKLESTVLTQKVVTAMDGTFAMRVGRDVRGRLILPEETDSLYAKTQESAMLIAGFTKDADLGDLSVIPGAVLAGRVIDPRGQALAGVNVSLTDASGLGRVGSRGGETTDARGKFEFRSLRPGKHQVSTTAPGFIPSRTEIDLAEGERRMDLSLRLAEGASISGNVFDDLGKPIAGAKVASYRKRELAGNISIRRFDDREAVETDANGYFALAGIDADSVVLRAFAKGYGDEQKDDVLKGASNVLFHLPRHGSIRGVLLDGRGDPIAGSRVWVKKDRGIAGIEIFEDVATTKSSEDGRYVLEGVPAGNVLVTADGDTHRPVEPVPLQLRPGGEIRDLRLVAETGAAIDVLVVDGQGAPIEGAKVKVSEFRPTGPAQGSAERFVTRSITSSGGPGGGSFRVYGAGGGSLGQGTTDAEGRVRIAGLPVGAVSLKAEHESMVAPAQSRVDLDASRVLEQKLIMKPGGFIQITTQDPMGQPLPETPYAVVGPMGVRKNGQTNGEGLATIGPLLPGSYSAVIGLDSGTHISTAGGMEMLIDSGNKNTLDASKQTLFVRSGETTEISLVRPILTHFSGMLSDASGPVASAQVLLSQGDGPSLGFGHGGLQATTDRDGRFSIKDVQAGTYTLEFGRPNALVKAEEELVIPPAQAELSRDLVLHGGTVRVLVVDDQDGLPIERAKVSVQRTGSKANTRRSMDVMMVSSSTDGSRRNTSVSVSGGPSTVMTDEDGIALLEDLPPGEYVLQITHQRYADQKVESVKVVDAEVTDNGRVTMSPAGFIRGTVTGFGEAGGMNIAMVRLKPVGSEAEPKMQPAMNGSFSFDGLRPGLYELSARRLGPGVNSDDWGVTQTVEVIAGERAHPSVPLSAVR